MGIECVEGVPGHLDVQFSWIHDVYIFFCEQWPFGLPVSSTYL